MYTQILKSVKIKQALEAFYLDYVNNFLTVECMSSYYGIDENTCNELINIGRNINNEIEFYNNKFNL